MDKKCPYCNKLYESEDMRFHLHETHKKEIIDDFNLFDTVINEHWADIVIIYKDIIKKVLSDQFAYDIVHVFGGEYYEEAISKLANGTEKVLK